MLVQKSAIDSTLQIAKVTATHDSHSHMLNAELEGLWMLAGPVKELMEARKVSLSQLAKTLAVTQLRSSSLPSTVLTLDGGEKSGSPGPCTFPNETPTRWRFLLLSPRHHIW